MDGLYRGFAWRAEVAASVEVHVSGRSASVHKTYEEWPADEVADEFAASVVKSLAADGVEPDAPYTVTKSAHVRVEAMDGHSAKRLDHWPSDDELVAMGVEYIDRQLPHEAAERVPLPGDEGWAAVESLEEPEPKKKRKR